MAADPLTDDLVVPLVEEQAVVTKKDVTTGKVSVSTHVETHLALIKETLRREDVVVERVPIGREVEVAPTIRQEGQVVIYPVVEERLHVEKRLFLKEELHVSYKISSEEVTETVSLRSVRADVERTPVDVAPFPLNPNRQDLE